MQDGGEIRIKTEERERLGDDPGTPAERSVHVRIIDQGCGMPPEIARHVFDPYFTTKGESGTGLGLPQVAAFMRASGGKVCVTTEPGVGTSFDLLFPIEDRQLPMNGNLWRQLDRWVNEGGRPDPAGPPVFVATRFPAELPGAPLPGVDPAARDCRAR